MKAPLLYKVYRTLRRGWKRMTPEAQRAVQTFVASQKTAHGYMNAGGHEDAYYQQFGEVLEAAFTPRKLLTTHIRLIVQESRHKDTVYGRFFDFLNDEMTLGKRGKRVELNVPKVMTTNAVCCILAMQHQMGLQSDATDVEWLQKRQDETGGFYASEQAPIPDLLSTAVALFTLRLLEINVKDATPFIQAHGLDNGGFAPTLYDDYSDVEYVFYGLLALGSI
ncbi:MAG: hypothetical protein IKP41_00550 [Bacteroidaceae bacterium]|nr:hypothetical protein [Bacteroidaceae bacterium]